MAVDKTKVLAFDLGNVIFGFDYLMALGKIKDRINVSVDFLFEQLSENKFGLTFEKGLVSSQQFYDDFKNKFKARLTYDEFSLIWCDIFYPHEDVIRLIEKLNKTYCLYMISNINELHFDFLHQRYSRVFDLFSGLILSYKVKSIKPEEKIYYALRDMAGADFKNIVYIDDREDLIKSARLLGLQCVRFKNYKQLLDDLGCLGVDCS